MAARRSPFTAQQEVRIREIVREEMREREAERAAARRELTAKFKDLREAVAPSKPGGTEDAQ